VRRGMEYSAAPMCRCRIRNIFLLVLLAAVVVTGCASSDIGGERRRFVLSRMLNDTAHQRRCFGRVIAIDSLYVCETESNAALCGLFQLPSGVRLSKEESSNDTVGGGGMRELALREYVRRTFRKGEGYCRDSITTGRYSYVAVFDSYFDRQIVRAAVYRIVQEDGALTIYRQSNLVAVVVWDAVDGRPHEILGCLVR
jgi:hypothetical protein